MMSEATRRTETRQTLCQLSSGERVDSSYWSFVLCVGTTISAEYKSTRKTTYIAAGLSRTEATSCSSSCGQDVGRIKLKLPFFSYVRACPWLQVLTFVLISKLEVGSEDQLQFQPVRVQNDAHPEQQQERPDGMFNQGRSIGWNAAQNLHITFCG